MAHGPQIDPLPLSLLASLCIHGLLIGLNFGAGSAGEPPPRPGPMQGTLVDRTPETIAPAPTMEPAAVQKTSEAPAKPTPNRSVPDPDVPASAAAGDHSPARFLFPPDLTELGGFIPSEEEIDITISVSPFGRVEKIDVGSRLPLADGTREALYRTLRRQSYLPATEGGKNVAGTMRIVVSSEPVPERTERNGHER